MDNKKQDKKRLRKATRQKEEVENRQGMGWKGRNSAL